MGEGNIPASTRFRLMAVIDPDVTVASTVTTGFLAAEEFANFMAVIMAGTLGTDATINAKLEQATDSGGSGVKDITGKAITELIETGANDSDKQAIINLRPDELDVANDFTHFRLSVTVAVATSDMAALVFGTDARYVPETDSTTVDEIVS